jgi:hypothetical protein
LFGKSAAFADAIDLTVGYVRVMDASAARFSPLAATA